MPINKMSQERVEGEKEDKISELKKFPYEESKLQLKSPDNTDRCNASRILEKMLDNQHPNVYRLFIQYYGTEMSHSFSMCHLSEKVTNIYFIFLNAFLRIF